MWIIYPRLGGDSSMVDNSASYSANIAVRAFLTEFTEELRGEVFGHKLPEGKEQILALAVEDHAWQWQYFEGNIGPGYGEGSVKCLFRDQVEVDRFDEDKIIFEYKNNKYQLYKCNWIKNENAFMIRKK